MIDSYDTNFLSIELAQLGYKFYYFASIDSTMNIIQKFALDRKDSNIIVLANHQTHGVGRDGRVWRDTANCSLMFSMLCYIPQEAVAIFADFVALSVCEALKSATGLGVQIKYPNDLVIDGKKLGGILVKNIYNDKLDYLGTNVGIGINAHYNQKELAKFPIDYPATSLDIATDSWISREKLLIEIARALRYLGTEIKVFSKNPKALDSFDQKWREASSVLGKEIAILEDDRIIEKGKVINTGIGKGIEIETGKGRKWFSLFDTDMKARVLN